MSMHGKKRDSAIEPMQETGDSYSKRMKLSQDRHQTGAHPEYEIVEDSNKQNDWTHLHEAASQIDLPRLDYLLELGKHDINAVTRESRHTALHKAVLCWFRIAKQIEKHGDHLEAINLLLDYGANPNIHDRSSETVLHAAVQTSSLDMTRVLIDCGAAVNVRSKKYETAPYGPAMEVLISMVLIVRVA
jgi:ankyrin repeat protein